MLRIRSNIYSKNLISTQKNNVFVLFLLFPHECLFKQVSRREESLPTTAKNQYLISQINSN